MSNGMIRVGPDRAARGWTSTGMGAISGFAAEPYSYTSEREVQAASVAACVSIER